MFKFTLWFKKIASEHKEAGVILLIAVILLATFIITTNLFFMLTANTTPKKILSQYKQQKATIDTFYSNIDEQKNTNAFTYLEDSLEDTLLDISSWSNLGLNQSLVIENTSQILLSNIAIQKKSILPSNLLPHIEITAKKQAIIDTQKSWTLFFYGALFFLLLLHVLSAVVIRCKENTWHLVLVISCVLFFVLKNQFSNASLIFWGESLVDTICISALLISATFFNNVFIDTKVVMPPTNKVTYLSLTLLPVLYLMILFFPSSPINIVISSAIATWFFGTFLWVGVYSMLLKVPASTPFLCAWILFAIGFFYNLTVSLLRGYHFENELIFQILSLSSMLLLSISSMVRAEFFKIERKERTEMLKLISKVSWESQSQYQHLVQQTNNVIFHLDKHFNFTYVSHRISKYLGYKESNLIGKSFLSIVYEMPSDNITKLIMQEKLHTMLITKSNISFRTYFINQVGLQKELSVYLNTMHANGQNTIFGKITEAIDDRLIQYLDKEEMDVTINNYISNTDLISERLTRNLERYLTKHEANLMRLGLCEMIVNAIEHGNFGISYNLKSRLLGSDSYIHYMRNKQTNEQNKKVHIHYKLNKTSVVYVINDEGQGFDHSHLKQFQAPSNQNSGNIRHGRGIAIAKMIFDKVHYNNKGNSVTLIKYMPPLNGYKNMSKAQISNNQQTPLPSQ